MLFGSVTSGRAPDLPGAETMVGLFINTLPLRVRVPLDAPLLPWLAQLQEQQFELLRHQHAPLAEISALAEVPRGQPLFETIFVYENYPLSGQLFERMESLGISELRAWDKTNYPLTLAVSPGPLPMLQVVYDHRRYNAFAIDILLGHLINLLSALPQNAERKLGELPLLDEAERRTIIDRNAAAHSDIRSVRCRSFSLSVPHCGHMHRRLAARAGRRVIWGSTAALEPGQADCRHVASLMRRWSASIWSAALRPLSPCWRRSEPAALIYRSILHIRKSGSHS